MLGGSGLEQVMQQQIADELGYSMEQPRGVARPAAYTAKLIERALGGEFNPDGALIFAAERRRSIAMEEQRRSDAERRRRAEEERIAKLNDPAAQARMDAAVALAAKTLGIRREG
ncbi:hypothetical protein Y882_08385 [Dyella japonica DSM 16301]|uniref:Uncharacterized protein n=1 Tax=Dyella japonica DSM 16301 TaxID=1440762 RepID=A0A0G9H3K7_9GAMM|nr:hypothetical protein Y882_08385 [Dyella japonica DSM 16301]